MMVRKREPLVQLGDPGERFIEPVASRSGRFAKRPVRGGPNCDVSVSEIALTKGGEKYLDTRKENPPGGADVGFNKHALAELHTR